MLVQKIKIQHLAKYFFYYLNYLKLYFSTIFVTPIDENGILYIKSTFMYHPIIIYDDFSLTFIIVVCSTVRI